MQSLSSSRYFLAMSDEWVLYYWPLAGRGEFVRLVFEEAGVKYKEVNDDIRNLINNGGLGGFPVFAPPVIKKGKEASISILRRPLVVHLSSLWML